jgi:hypothetical protein
MTATVTYEYVRLGANGGAQGIGWAQYETTDDVAGFGGWAEQPLYPPDAPTQSVPDPDVDQFGNNAFVGLPMIASHIQAAGFDSGHPANIRLDAGFACTPNTWITVHLWIAHVS